MKTLLNIEREVNTQTPRVAAVKQYFSSRKFQYHCKVDHLPHIFRYYRKHFNAEDKFDIYMSKADQQVKIMDLNGRHVQNVLTIGFVASWTMWVEYNLIKKNLTREFVANKKIQPHKVCSLTDYATTLFFELLK